ncbi:MAG: hypothetical protein LBU67_10975 [Oscillospiraceae bacterium]|jgi:hypothetical protein|nr:hypothetical protein [Oscillospiraceae bacterium]
MTEIQGRLGHGDIPEAAAGEQPLTCEQRTLTRRAYEFFELFRAETQEMRQRAAACRRIFLLDDPEQDAPGTPPAARAPQLHTLKSTVVSCVADQMDNMPEAVLLPERPELADVAADLTDLVRYVLERNRFDRLHHQRVMDFFQTGTSVTQVAWDADMNEGAGEIALVRWPREGFYWDPAAENIQDARALFKASFHPLSWYAQHYPQAAPYIHADGYARREGSLRRTAQRGDEDVLMLEYWYRRYDARTRRCSIHMACLAGGALLYCSQDERPDGVYAHGRYPFVLDVYTPVEGQPVGNGMVWEFAPMQRYVNRYAKYIDENARMSAKARLLVNNAAGLEDEDLTDWNRNLIRGDNISENALRWFQSQPLSGQVNAQLAAFQDQIKLDSGQNQFLRGEGGMGVTAASAIAALQEAGGKTSRLYTAVLASGFREMVDQALWLIAQHYDGLRTRLITGRDAMPRLVNISAGRLLYGDWALSAAHPDPMPAPPYTVQVQVQRRNPMRVQAQNELVLQVAQMQAQSGAPLPASTVLKMLVVDGKDRILPILEEDERRILGDGGAAPVLISGDRLL